MLRTVVLLLLGVCLTRGQYPYQPNWEGGGYPTDVRFHATGPRYIEHSPQFYPRYVEDARPIAPPSPPHPSECTVVRDELKELRAELKEFRAEHKALHEVIAKLDRYHYDLAFVMQAQNDAMVRIEHNTVNVTADVQGLRRQIVSGFALQLQHLQNPNVHGTRNWSGGNVGDATVVKPDDAGVKLNPPFLSAKDAVGQVQYDTTANVLAAMVLDQKLKDRDLNFDKDRARIVQDIHQHVYSKQQPYVGSA